MNYRLLGYFALTSTMEQLRDRQVSRSIKAVNRHVVRYGYPADQILELDDKEYVYCVIILSRRTVSKTGHNLTLNKDDKRGFSVTIKCS